MNTVTDTTPSSTSRKYDESRDGLKVVAINTVPKGTFFRKYRGECKACRALPAPPSPDYYCVRCNNTGGEFTERVYIATGYDRGEKAYGIPSGYGYSEADDINREFRPLKKTTLVLVGFTY